jgi:hypothetical protein
MDFLDDSGGQKMGSITILINKMTITYLNVASSKFDRILAKRGHGTERAGLELHSIN